VPLERQHFADLKRGRGCSRLLNMGPFDTSYTTFYGRPLSVSEALNCTGKERLVRFRQLKRQVIAQYNDQQSARCGQIITERDVWSEKEPVTCGTCHVVISKSYFWWHRRLCTAVVMKNNCSLPAPIPPRVAQQETGYVGLFSEGNFK